jgi:hypothetical protein
MRERPRGRGSLIAPGLAATLGALAVAPAASPAASSVAPPSLAQFISATRSVALFGLAPGSPVSLRECRRDGGDQADRPMSIVIPSR